MSHFRIKHFRIPTHRKEYFRIKRFRFPTHRNKYFRTSDFPRIATNISEHPIADFLNSEHPIADFLRLPFSPPKHARCHDVRNERRHASSTTATTTMGMPSSLLVDNHTQTTRYHTFVISFSLSTLFEPLSSIDSHNETDKHLVRSAGCTNCCCLDDNLFDATTSTLNNNSNHNNN